MFVSLLPSVVLLLIIIATAGCSHLAALAAVSKASFLGNDRFHFVSRDRDQME